MNSSIRPEFEFVGEFMPVQIICISDKDRIKNAMLRTRSNMVFFGTQGQVTPK